MMPYRQGAGISFELRGAEGCSLEEGAQLEVYTTRPDTVSHAEPLTQVL